jgi:hypothetical protein
VIGILFSRSDIAQSGHECLATTNRPEQLILSSFVVMEVYYLIVVWKEAGNVSGDTSPAGGSG